MVSGIYDGIKYDAIQREIRGNHLALVAEGRSGHDVAVLDHFKFQFDSKEIQMPDMKREGEIQDEEMSLEECVKMVKELAEKVNKMMKSEEDESEEGEAKKELSEKAAEEGDTKDEEGEYNKFVNKAEIEDEEESNSKEQEEMSQEDDKPGDMSKPKDKKMKDKKGMDAKILNQLTKDVNHLKNHSTKALFEEISRRDTLAQKLSTHIGTFDHANKTFQEVAQYGVKKLGLRCRPGHEASMLEGYLSAAKSNSIARIATDSQVKSSCVDAYLNGGK